MTLVMEKTPKYSVYELGYDRHLVKIRAAPMNAQQNEDTPPQLTNVIDGGVPAQAVIGGTSDEKTGTVITADGAPIETLITTVLLNRSVLLSARVIAIGDNGSNYYAGFERKILVKNLAGVVTFFDQIQDAFTMKEQNYRVDFSINDNRVFLRVWGLEDHVVAWTFSVKILSG